MNKFILLASVLLGTTVLSQQQQCRFVPVCDENQRPDGGSIKGDKGEVGSPGKAGPHGPQGIKGEQGLIGDATVLIHLVTNLMEKLEQQSNLLNETSRKLEKIYEYVTPVSCKSALVKGRQKLRTGDEVYCDNGWQVFQHRYDGSENFNKPWEDYKHGFGNLSSEFWLGLEKLHQITTSARRCRLRINFRDFKGSHSYAEYRNLSIGSESSSYQLTLAGFSGSAGDSMLVSSIIQNGMRFSTVDRDNDLDGRNCAFQDGGPWWHKNCGYARLNGLWSRSSTSDTSMSWYHWKNRWGGLKSSMMKVQCDY